MAPGPARSPLTPAELADAVHADAVRGLADAGDLEDDPPTLDEVAAARDAVAVLAAQAAAAPLIGRATWGTRPSDWLELRRAGRLVVACWGDGDEVDPDRMDAVVARLAAAVADLEDAAAGDG